MSDTDATATAPTPDAPAIDLDTPTPPQKSTSELVAELEALRAEVARLRAEVARLRAGEEPVAPHDPLSTGGHLLWVLGHATAEMRNSLATLLIRSVQAASRCSEEDHTTRIQIFQHRADAYGSTLEHARAETERLDRTSGPEGRAVAMSLRYALLPAEAAK
jgi:hypothetical protein